MSLGDYRTLGPIAVQGKDGCEDVRCRRYVSRDENGEFVFGPCLGWHCPYCGEPCSMMGHHCPAGDAMLDAARKIADEQDAA